MRRGHGNTGRTAHSNAGTPDRSAHSNAGTYANAAACYPHRYQDHRPTHANQDGDTGTHRHASSYHSATHPQRSTARHLDKPSGD